MRPIPILAGLVAVSTVVRAWAGLRVPTPWIAADEMIYAELGRSLWTTGHLQILGQDAPFYSLVHPALIGLPLALFDAGFGYDVARVLQAFTMSLTAVPIFFWGRRLMRDEWALVAAALTLTLPGLAYSGLLMTETVFVPAVALAAWTMWRTLARPTLWTQAALGGAVLLAVLTRLQGVVLVPVFLLAVAIDAAAGRSLATARRLWPAAAALMVLAIAAVASGLGAYEPAGSASYDVVDVLRFVAYHAADATLLVGVVPMCALVALALARPAPDVRAFLAVSAALTAGIVAEVAVFASRYVGRLAERDLLGVAPVLFLALALWLDRGAPRTRFAASAIALGAVALVLVLPLGRLVHRAALPDALTLVPVWELGHYEAVAWTFAGAAALAFALLPHRALIAVPLLLALVLVSSSVAASREIEHQAATLRSSFFGGSPTWVDSAVRDRVAYFYDGEAHWNAVWSYVFWNRRIDDVLLLAGAKRVPGPLPQTIVHVGDAAARNDVDAPYVVGSTAFTFFGERVAEVTQQGLVQKGLVLWRIDPPVRVSTLITGVQGSGDIYGPAQLSAFDCTGGTFELTLVAKGAPVHVDFSQLGRPSGSVDLAAEQVWNGAIPATPRDGSCMLELRPSGLVGSTKFAYARP